MKDGFIKVCAATPEVSVACPTSNAETIIDAITVAAGDHAKLIVLPELCVSGYTCEDLFWQSTLIEACERACTHIIQATADLDAIIMLGTPVQVTGKLYNTALVFHKGKILGIVPKQFLPNYNEFYEMRHFCPGTGEVQYINYAQQFNIAFGANQLFSCSTMPNLTLAVEICEDLWAPDPPSAQHARAGATIICNLSASTAQVGKASWRRLLVNAQSGRLIAGYVYASAGFGESSQDLVFPAHNIISENGVVLAESVLFSNDQLLSEIDVSMLAQERARNTTFRTPLSLQKAYTRHLFALELEETTLTRSIDPHPFVPRDRSLLFARAGEILSIQAHALAKRLVHTHTTSCVVGVSGGLDSTLALLVCARAFDLLELSHAGIIACTMPGFGTTERTHGNAYVLARALGASFREIPISAAVRAHFADINHDEAVHDTVYENAQARERTQILMDLANQEDALVIGTGDLSELALGWATYNADHMSMYSVNVGVPKTLVRYIVEMCAEAAANAPACAQVSADTGRAATENASLRDVLLDVLNTPVSPELLPPSASGTIAQKTEDLVGPYELHDFFLYALVRKSFGPKKIFRLACIAHGKNYTAQTILKWLKVFYRRFFSQQFKRSCLPDGPKVGSVALSPRGDWRMPSDALANEWMRELNDIKLNDGDC